MNWPRETLNLSLYTPVRYLYIHISAIWLIELLFLNLFVLFMYINELLIGYICVFGVLISSLCCSFEHDFLDVEDKSEEKGSVLLDEPLKPKGVKTLWNTKVDLNTCLQNHFRHLLYMCKFYHILIPFYLLLILSLCIDWLLLLCIFKHTNYRGLILKKQMFTSS